MRRLPPLAALRAFEAAARHLSFKAAADELLVTPTAISHQIRLLEETVGRKLFERRTRQVVMTAEAQLLYPVLRHGFDEFAEAIGRISAQRARPAVTISATRAFTAKWLVPRLAALQRELPTIDIRLLATDDPVDLAAGAADLAIRYGRGPYPGLKAHPFLADHFAPVAHPSLGVTGPVDLARHRLIHFDWHRPGHDRPDWARWASAAALTLPTTPFLRFTDEDHAIQATIAGQGIGLLSQVLVADHLAHGSLVQPFGPVLDGPSFHLVEPTAAPRTREAAEVRDWLLTQR